MTVRAGLAAAAQVLGEPLGHAGRARRAAARGRRRPAGRSPRARSRCARPRPRAAAGRCRGRGRAPGGRPCPAAARAARRRRAPRARRSSRSPPASEPRLGARADPGQQADRERREERGLAAGPHDRQPAGLAPVGGDLGDDLRAREPERARELRARADHGLHRLGERARVVEGRRDLAEVEVALVDPGLLDRRHDLAHERPDLAASTRGRATCRGRTNVTVRAAAQRLGARHRREDAVAPRRVVRGRDDAAAVRVAADDERPPAQLGALELLHGGEEGVQVEVRDDHGPTRLSGRPERRVWFVASNG